MGKRGNGEGGISRRKDGLYMACYTVHIATGVKRKAVYGKTPQRGCGEAHQGSCGPGHGPRLGGRTGR